MLLHIIRLSILFWALVFAQVSYPQTFPAGWSLAGNNLTTPIEVSATFSSQSNITTVWKWVAKNSQWAFYAPTLDNAGTLSSYTTSHGYLPLTTINPGEGFWINASAPVTLSLQTGASLAQSKLVAGWNLVASESDISPAALTSIVGNITTLWAWDNTNSAWYFYSPSLSPSALASYIQSQGYEDFGSLTLGNGLGFWVNYGGTGAYIPPNATAAATTVAIAAVM